MADTDRTLEVLIKLGYVGADKADEAREAIRGLKGETANATDATEQFNVKGRAQFLLMSEINRIAPGLGDLLHAAFAGPLGPIILVGIAIAQAKKALDGYNASLDAMGESAAAGHAEAIQAVRTAWDNVEDGMAKYFADLQAAAKDKDPTKTLIANLKALQDEQSKAEIAQMKLLGRPQSQIDAAQDEHDKKTVALLQEEKNMRIADMTNAQFAVEKDKKQAALADARVTSRKAELDALTKAGPDLEKQAESQRQIIERNQAALTPEFMALHPSMAVGAAEETAKAQTALDAILNQQKNNADRQKQIESQNQADLTAKATADQALTDAKAKATAAQSRITELSGPQGEIAQTALRDSVASAGRNGNEVIEQATKLVKDHADQFADMAATMRYYNTHAGSANKEIAAIRAEIQRHAREIADLQTAMPNTPH